MLRLIFIILTTQFAFTGAPAAACNLCGTDEPLYHQQAPVFSEDPFVEPGTGIVSVVEEQNIRLDPQSGECVVYNTYDDAVGVEPTYTDGRFEVVKIRWEATDGSVSYLTLPETAERARAQCYPSALS